MKDRLALAKHLFFSIPLVILFFVPLGCVLTKPNLSITDEKYNPPRGSEIDKNFLEAKSILAEISLKNPLLAIELGKLPELRNGISTEETRALGTIKRIIRERSLRAKLKRLSTRDGLTSLYNRRYFDQNLRHEAIRAFRQNYNMYLLFIDLDNLKGYNDNYGHQQGDNLLRELAKIILGNIRKDADSAYRYGGDEFAVVLPHASRQQALMVAKRLLTEYNKRNLTLTSLSIGLAKLEGTRETLERDLQSLIREADQALYRAKTSRGNQLCDDQGKSYRPVSLYET